MAHKKSRPGNRKTGAWESFSYWGPPISSKPRYAWVAGEPEWFEVHEHNQKQHGTKVCLNWFTDGALKCPRCRPLHDTTTVAYLPLYREEDGKPVFLIVHESAADVIDGLEFGVFVYVGRVDGVSSVYAKPADEQRTMNSVNPTRNRPCYLMPSLLTVWDYPELDGWMRVNDKLKHPALDKKEAPAPTSDNAVSQPAKQPARESGPVDLKRTMVELIMRKRGLLVPDLWGEAEFDKLLKGHAESENGNGKPKK